jgi:hypothetical protein
MLEFLKNHPFPVKAFFESSIVLTFAFPKEELEKFLPKHLALDCYQDKYAFIAVALVQTKNLRPAFFPKFLGNDFFLVGFRIFVKYTTKNGKRLRGLYILKSQTDSKKMEFLGNIFTHYNYEKIDLQNKNNNFVKSLRSEKSAFKINYSNSNNEIPLPNNSPFLNWKEARRFAGPLPHTFTFLEDKNQVLIIKGNRENWTPTPIQIIDYDFSFFEEKNLKNPILANAFEITNIPYQWDKGIIEQW